MKDFTILKVIIFIALSIPTIKALTGAPWVPTPMKAVKKMLKLGKLKSNHKIIDIGCGDGRIVYLGNKLYGCNSIGYELSPLVYIWALIRKLLWKSKAQIKFRDFTKENIDQVDIIFCYLLTDSLKKFKSKFDKEMKKGSKIISYAFPIKGWKEIHKEERDKKNRIAPIWIYEIGKSN